MDRGGVNRSSSDVGRFGFGLAIRGHRAVIGAPETFEHNFGFWGPRGGAFVFERSGSAWSWSHQIYPFVPTIDGGGTGDRFGASVATDGELILVGGPRNISVRFGTDRTGAALLQNATGSVRRILVPSTAQADAGYGEAVALTSEFIAIGATNTSAALPVAIYATAGQIDASAPPAPELALLESPVPSGARFGNSVALAGAIVAAGAPRGHRCGRQWSGRRMGGDLQRHVRSLGRRPHRGSRRRRPHQSSGV
jgi:hypothetical protein